MTPQLRALIALCAAAAMVCLVAVARWMETHSGPAWDDGAVLLAEARVGQAPDLGVPRERQRVAPRAVAAPVSDASTASQGPGDVAARALEVLVLDRGTPLAGVRVACDGLGGPSSQVCGADGIARWQDLSPGLYELEVAPPRGVPVTLRAEVLDTSGGLRNVVRLGGAIVEGTLFDPSGQQAALRPIRLRQTARKGGPELFRELLTDVGGQFRFEGLAAGTMLLVDPDASTTWQANGRQAAFELTEGERRRVDLGQPDGEFTWRGQLRTASGAALDEPVVLRVHEALRGWSVSVNCAEDGSFSTSLRTGDWVATLSGFSGPVEVARIALRDRDLELDATVPGPCLRATLRYPAAHDANSIQGSAALSLRRPDSDESRDFMARGRRVFIAGVPSGDWRVAARRTGLEIDTDREVDVSLADGAGLVELALDVDWTLE